MRHLLRIVTYLLSIAALAVAQGANDELTALVTCDLTGTPEVWTVSVNGGWPNLVTNLPNPVTSVYWSPKSDWLAFSAAPGGGMNEQTFLIHPDGTNPQRITDGGKEDNWLDGWSPDGKTLMIASNRRGHDGMDDYVVDPFQKTFRLTS
jgi:Tol biopolymer transport system component